MLLLIAFLFLCSLLMLSGFCLCFLSYRRPLVRWVSKKFICCCSVILSSVFCFFSDTKTHTNIHRHLCSPPICLKHLKKSQMTSTNNFHYFHGKFCGAKHVIYPDSNEALYFISPSRKVQVLSQFQESIHTVFFPSLLFAVSLFTTLTHTSKHTHRHTHSRNSILFLLLTFVRLHRTHIASAFISYAFQSTFIEPHPWLNLFDYMNTYKKYCDSKHDSPCAHI